jgi:CheY-like chemotaxis protein
MSATRKKILLVDDTATVRMLERAILGTEYEYSEAQNGAEAVAQAAKHQPDLILMDLNMPIKDGIEGLADLKQQASTQRIPVIIITSESEPAKRERCLHLGCAEFISKPLDKNRLKELVRRYLFG